MAFYIIEKNGLTTFQEGGAAPDGVEPVDAATYWAALSAAMTPAPAGPPTKDDLKSYAANKRWQLQHVNIVVNGSTIDMSEDSQNMINKAYVSIKDFDLTSVNFKAASGWVVIDATIMSAIAKAVALRVQACFNAEYALDDEIDAGTITTTAQIDAYAWPA